MHFRLLRRLSEGVDGTALYRTFRHPSGLLAGSLGPALMATNGVVAQDPDLKWVWILGAALTAWFGWTFRMTLRTDGVVVQNFGIPRLYPWHDIQTARMTTPRYRDPVLALYLKDGRRVRVWAVSVVQGIGASYCSRAGAQVLASLKESRKQPKPPP